jgi:hypothetical protein
MVTAGGIGGAPLCGPQQSAEEPPLTALKEISVHHLLMEVTCPDLPILDTLPLWPDNAVFADVASAADVAPGMLSWARP